MGGSREKREGEKKAYNKKNHKKPKLTKPPQVRQHFGLDLNSWGQWNRSALVKLPVRSQSKKKRQLSGVSHQDLIQAEFLQWFHRKGNNSACKEQPNKTFSSHIKVLSRVKPPCSSQDSSLPQTQTKQNRIWFLLSCQSLRE